MPPSPLMMGSALAFAIKQMPESNVTVALVFEPDVEAEFKSNRDLFNTQTNTWRHCRAVHGMRQMGTALDGETAALVTTGASLFTGAALPQWLLDLKTAAQDLKESHERPPGKPFGRWLGDFLDQDTPSGLLPAEEKVLLAAVNGEACLLETRASQLWSAFEVWRDTTPKEPEGDLGFVEAIARFTEAQPEPIQEIIIEATRHAIDALELPAYWEPKSVAEVEAFARAQLAFLSHLEAEARPESALEQARTDGRIYDLAVEAVLDALAAKPNELRHVHGERDEPSAYSAKMKAKLAEESRLLRGFFDGFIGEVKRLTKMEPHFTPILKRDLNVLREPFESVLARYQGEEWRHVDPDDHEVRVRAQFLRFLALGGDEFAPVHESGIALDGAAIENDFDLSGSVISQPLSFVRCYFSGRLVLSDATTRSLNFSGCRVHSIDGENARIVGSLLLERGFHASNGVALRSTKVESRFACGGGGIFAGSDGVALDFRGACIGTDVDLGQGFRSVGEVTFKAARIGGALNCAGAVFLNRSPDGKAVALRFDGATIGGNVSLGGGLRCEGAVSGAGVTIKGALRGDHASIINITEDGKGCAFDLTRGEVAGDVTLCDGFSATGLVTFRNALIGGTLTFAGGHFNNAVNERGKGGLWPHRRAAVAIDLSAACIGGALGLVAPGRKGVGADILGSMRLTASRVRNIVDRPDAWPRRKVSTADGKRVPTFLYLDGFTYDAMTGRGEFPIADRKHWLDRQPPEHLGIAFCPQPFDQVVKVYRESDDRAAAREIAKFKKHRHYGALFQKLWHGWRKPSKPFQPDASHPLNAVRWPFGLASRFLYGATASVFLALRWAVVGFGTAYGHGWGRLMLFLLLLWGAGGLFYREVALQGGFAPANPVIFLNKDLEARCGTAWTACKDPPAELPSFMPFLYSLDIMLPLMDLGQKANWQPIDKPVIMVFPQLASDRAYDLPDGIPHVVIEEHTLAKGRVGMIVKAQAVLGWAMLGLLGMIIVRLIRRDLFAL